jgi:hypothetical protein
MRDSSLRSAAFRMTLNSYKNFHKKTKGNLLISVIFIMSGLLVFASILLNKSNKILGKQQESEMQLQSQYIAESLVTKTANEYRKNIPKNAYSKTYDICLNFNHTFDFEKPVINFLETSCLDTYSQQTVGKVEIFANHRKDKIQRYLDRYKEFSYPFENRNYKQVKSLEISWWNELLEKNPPIEIVLTHPCQNNKDAQSQNVTLGLSKGDIPVSPSVIPAPPSVIPAKAGTHTSSPEILRQAQDDKIENCTTIIDKNTLNIQYFQGKNTYNIPDATDTKIQFKSVTEPIFIGIKNSDGEGEEYFLEDSLLFMKVDVKIESENNAFAPIRNSIERDVEI